MLLSVWESKVTSRLNYIQQTHDLSFMDDNLIISHILTFFILNNNSGVSVCSSNATLELAS